LSHAMPDITVVLFGEGPERVPLGKRADGRNVVFAGFRADAARLLRALDVFVHPCPEDNQPLAVLEAMAGGVPVVGADRGGVATMITHEVTGLLAPATPEGMGRAVRRFLADRDLAARLGAAAAVEVRREAEPCTMARRVESLYQREPTAR
jgi:glycosyltransferase involved in cell wall biosynthesis